MHHSNSETLPISPWIARWSHLLAPNSELLDLACGSGRHTLHFLRLNHRVTAVDIAQPALEIIANQLSLEERNRCELIHADLENAPWPLANRQFDAIVVTNYLWRPKLRTLLQSLREGGFLIYETFATGNETVGKPSRPDFLLQAGELLQLCAQEKLRIIAYQDGFCTNPDRYIQCTTAVREVTSATAKRYSLSAH